MFHARSENAKPKLQRLQKIAHCIELIDYEWFEDGTCEAQEENYVSVSESDLNELSRRAAEIRAFLVEEFTTVSQEAFDDIKKFEAK